MLGIEDFWKTVVLRTYGCDGNNIDGYCGRQRDCYNECIRPIHNYKNTCVVSDETTVVIDFAKYAKLIMDDYNAQPSTVNVMKRENAIRQLRAMDGIRMHIECYEHSRATTPGNYVQCTIPPPLPIGFLSPPRIRVEIMM